MTQRVLIAEDEPGIVTSIEFLMRRCGLETRTVMDGSGVMDAIADFAPDLVLLDVMLPGCSGFDLCREIRHSHSGMRVLMLTAMSTRGDVASGLEAGADAYVTKPFSTHELVERVRELLA